MVPWIGFSLSALINKVQPTAKANYVQLSQRRTSRAKCPGFNSGGLDWPYQRRFAHGRSHAPAALLCFGLYGEVLPNQNGAPVRIMLPWKYGFKSGKAVVKFQFVEKQPPTAWNEAAPNEYGFYSNVNPTVDHPRWSQATERRLDGSFGGKRIKTLMFNGYDQVASLYSGMDLRKYLLVVLIPNRITGGSTWQRRVPNPKWIKPPVFLICLVPLAVLVWKGIPRFARRESGAGDRALHGHLGAGRLCVTLSITPLRKLTHQNWLIRFRRMFGLFAFFYALPASHHLYLARRAVRFRGHDSRHLQAAVHHCGIYRVVADGAAGNYFDQRNDPPPGRQTLAIAASPDLRQRDRGSDALLLAGEVR